MLRTVKSFDLRNQRVLMRVDFNVPLKNGKVEDDFRIRSALPSIKYCIESGASLVLMSHLGRPNGNKDINLSLMPVGEALAGLLEVPIKFSDDCISQDALDTSLSLKSGEIHLLENLRFHKDEEGNDSNFSSRLSRHGRIYINDAFGTAHRKHASNAGTPSYFKNKGIGLLIEKELAYLSGLMKKPKRPLTLILGGSKIDSKLDLIEKFLNKADNILIGGGMAFTFLKALGKNIGNSLIDENMIDTAKSIINKARSNNVKCILPLDVFCAESLDNPTNHSCHPVKDIPSDLMGLDIGPKTIDMFKQILNESKTVVWNGPVGVFEIAPFDNGTRELAKTLSLFKENNKLVIIGGGDTASAIKNFGLLNKMNHVSTGGGASLELLCDLPLPAITSLEA